jgi:hypothetical protein
MILDKPLGLFGLSAGEVPDPAMVAKAQIYQAFGVGGRFSPANDGSALLGAPVVAPHYSAMIASLYPQEAIAMWSWLINALSRPRWIFVLALAAIPGALRYNLTQPHFDQTSLATYNDRPKPVIVEGVVIAGPDVRDKYANLRVEAGTLIVIDPASVTRTVRDCCSSKHRRSPIITTATA